MCQYAVYLEVQEVSFNPALTDFQPPSKADFHVVSLSRKRHLLDLLFHDNDLHPPHF